jgi:hypothetical protein
MYITRVQPQSLLSTSFSATYYSIKKINLSLGEGIIQKELEKITTLLVSSYVALGPPTTPFHP